MNNCIQIKLSWLNPISLPHYDQPMGEMVKFGLDKYSTPVGNRLVF